MAPDPEPEDEVPASPDPPALTLTGRFQASVARHGQRTAVRYHDGEGWAEISYRKLGARVRRASLGLQALGVEPGDRVAILSANRPEWAIMDFAILHAGGVPVPIYDTLKPDQMAYTLQDSGAQVLAVEGDLWPVAREAMAETKGLRWVILLDPVADPPRDAMTLEELEEEGAVHDHEHPEAFGQRWQAVEPEDLATLIYTSGTTGVPKGVELTHGNITSNIRAGLELLPLGEGERYLSFLPLSHSFERIVGHFGVYWIGATITYARSLDTVAEDLQVARPTLLIGLPRFYEKIQAGILQRVQQAPWHRRRLFAWATRSGARIFAHRENGTEPTRRELLSYGLADRLVLTKVRRALGLDELKVAGSGAAALDPSVARFFGSLGILIVEGYGMTEASPIIATNRIDDFRIGSVGKELPGVEVRIDTEAWDGPEGHGELIARGPNVMRGYWNRPDETAETVTDDGWLRTGDVAYRDGDGYLYITDRKKALFKTSYGKYVPPQRVEGLLQNDPLVEQAVCLGAERKYVAALLVPDFDALQQRAREQGLGDLDREALLAHSFARSCFDDAVDRANEQLNRWEQVKRYALLEAPLEVGEELTPTMKVKRRVVEERYADVIQRLYTDA